MAFEGEHKIIPIKGIVRAGSDTMCEDGAMNEVVGLEYKDGSYVPYKASMYLDGAVDPSKNILIHKTSKGEIVIVFDSTSVYWITIEGFKHNGSQKFLSSHVGKIELVGDSLSILASDKIYTYIFTGSSYDLLPDDLSGFNTYGVRFRVTRGMAGTDKTKDSFGTELPIVCAQYLQSSLYGSIGQNARQIKNRWDEFMAASNDVALGSSLLTKAQGLVTENGGLTGYVVVCYAFRLTNGDLVYASHPVLLGPPSEKQYGNFSSPTTDDKSSKYRLYKFTDGPRGGINTETYPYTGVKTLDITNEQVGVSMGVMTDDGIVTSGVFKNVEKEALSSEIEQYVYHTSYAKNVKYNDAFKDVSSSSSKFFFSLCYDAANVSSLSGELGTAYNPSPNEYEAGLSGFDKICLADTSPLPLTSAISMWIRAGLSGTATSGDGSQKYDAVYKTISCSGLSNKLQMAIDYSLIKDLPDNVSSLCVFISPEISPYRDITKDNYVTTHGPFLIGSALVDNGTDSDNLRIMHTFTPQYRSKEQVVDDIKNISSLYKVKEISRDELISMANDNTSKWIDIELKGVLGDALLTQETLPVTAYDYTKFTGYSSSSYNYRLHVGNIKRKLYDGYHWLALINDYENGRGQDGNNTSDDTDYSFKKYGSNAIKNIITEVYIKNADGTESVVVMKNNDESSNFYINGYNRMLVYPNPNAYKMVIYNIAPSGNSKCVFNLTSNKRLGFSYYINPDLSRFYIEHFNRIDTVTTATAKNTITSRNTIRVSDVAAPTIFPVSNTYTIGNGRVLGFARMQTALSDDTYGRNPLLVFCTDGIYTMEVDTTGGAYTSINMLSNEICVNANTICEINGGVVFASPKGLMVVTPNGVTPFAPFLNGVAKHLPDSSSTDGRRLYDRMVTANTLTSSVSDKDFIDFVKDENTHIAYISIKNKLLVYNSSTSYAYWIDIDTRNTTKISGGYRFHNNDYVKPMFLKGAAVYHFERDALSGNAMGTRIPVLLQTRPIKLLSTFKSGIRIVLKGNYGGDSGTWASLLVLGSYDGVTWHAIGSKEMPLNNGRVYDIGCDVDRVSVKYLMVIFTGTFTADSSIDTLEIMSKQKYNNKLR